MKNVLIKDIRIPVSMCDHTGHLDVPGFFTIFMDMASEHATDINMGMNYLLEKGLIWLAVKSKFRFYSKPELFSTVTATTWPAEPARIRGDRLYKMEQDGKLIAEGKNEWAIFHPESSKLVKFAEVYPENFVHWDEIVCEGRYAKLKDNFDDAEEIGRYTVASGDLDTSRHMNNVEYLKVIFSAFSSTQLEEMNVSEVDITYKNQCYEGEDLVLKRKTTEEGYEIGIIKADGTTAAIARITLV
ncbi:MAG: hypothetical protein J6Q18_00875 [Oscillospiraceae bacterium]|nr:hypothetical protein [Oscillospiraceae bacterium]